MVNAVNGNTSTVHMTQVSGATTQSIEGKHSGSNTGASSSINYRKQWSCTKALKNTLYRFYNWLCKWIVFLPKRQQTVPVNQSGSNHNERPYPRVEHRDDMVIMTPSPVESEKWASGITKMIQQDPEYRKNPNEYIWNLLKANGHYRYNTGDPVLEYFLNLHKFINYKPEEIIFHKNFAKEIDAVMQAVKTEPEYIKNPRGYLEAAIKPLQENRERTQQDRIMLQALWELQTLLRGYTHG